MTMIVDIAFNFVIILVNIAGVIGLVMKRVIITIRMEDITIELQVIIKCYYLLNFGG